ncbi:MAG: hypothetical protein FWD26_11310 [Treponema sp.]|nr:hypothetical protein [Treponema sp.]
MDYKEEMSQPDNKNEILGIFRMLEPEHQVNLLSWVHLAYTAESSVRKLLGFEVPVEVVSSLKTQEYSCEN